MKKLVLLLLTFPFFSNGQKAPVKFGDVTLEEVKMVRYDKDTSASAMVLVDYGESSIEYTQEKGFELSFERTMRLKIFSKEGYAWGDFLIPLYVDERVEEKLVGLKASTYNLEKGTVVEMKLKSEAIFREKTEKNLMIVKFAMPNVKEGSLIEITYRVRSPFLFNFQDWDFQNTIPTQWSEYRVHIPEYFQYKKQIQGYLAIAVDEFRSSLKTITLHYKERAGSSISTSNIASTTFESQNVEYKENYNRWIVKDAPAFRREPNLTTHRDYISKIDFEIDAVNLPNQPGKSYNNSWEDLGRSYNFSNEFGGVVKGSGFLKEYVDQAVAGKTDPIEKIGAIYSFVRENVLWDETYRKYSDENLKRVLENRKGSSAEVNLMLISMLQKAEIKAYPVLVSTRDHGFIRRDIPRESQFNYVIAAVELEGSYFLLDATDRSLPMKVLPKRCLNGQGLLVADEQSEWIKINPIKSRTMIDSDISIAADGTLKGKIQFTRDAYHAQEVRKEFFKNGKEQYTGSLAASCGWEISSSDIQNMENLSESVIEKHEFQSNHYVQVAGDHMYFNPLLVTALKENPFKSETREYPVDFGSLSDIIYVARITLPEGWVVEELPKPKILVLPGNTARCTYSVAQNGSLLLVTSQLAINKAMFAPDEYTVLRDFYAWVVAKHAEQVVLKKN